MCVVAKRAKRTPKTKMLIHEKNVLALALVLCVIVWERSQVMGNNGSENRRLHTHTDDRCDGNDDDRSKW